MGGDRMGCTHHLENEDIELKDPRVAIAGIGGAGVNCIDRLTRLGFHSGDMYLINTDAKSLHGKTADRILLLGRHKFQGRGAGGDPRTAEECAIYSMQEIRELLIGKDIVFLVAGLGGGTGTGVTPVVAEVVRELGGIVVPICTLPFRSEGRERGSRARAGAQKLHSISNSVILLDNNKLLSIEPNLPVYQAFSMMDQVIADTIMSVLGTFQGGSYMNIDFSDVKSVLQDGGLATIIYGESASTLPEVVVKDALMSPFLDIDYSDAKGALIKIIGGKNLTIRAFNAIVEGIVTHISEDALVKPGLEIREEYDGRVCVFGILTGVHSDFLPKDHPKIAEVSSTVLEGIFSEIERK